MRQMRLNATMFVCCLCLSIIFAPLFGRGSPDELPIFIPVAIIVSLIAGIIAGTFIDGQGEE